MSGGDGGNGVVLVHSTLSHKDVTMQGGLGGESGVFEDLIIPGGDDGLALMKDEHSEIIEESHVSNWEIYQ